MTDWPRLSQVVEAIFMELGSEQISHLLRRYLNGTVVACHGREIIGFYALTASSQHDVAWLDYIGVMPNWRGHGVAHALLFRCEHHARSAGFSSVALDAYAHNTTARHFYERNGYACCGEKTYAEGVKRRYSKTLASNADASPLMVRSLAPIGLWTRIVRKLLYSAIVRIQPRERILSDPNRLQ